MRYDFLFIFRKIKLILDELIKNLFRKMLMIESSYKIKNGEQKELMRDISLSGMTLEVLNRVSAIGKNIHYSDGMCGKGGQNVRVCDGGPYIRVDNVSVGGLS